MTGLSIPRLFSGAVLALGLLVSHGGLRAQPADATNLAGTMPEDYLPQLKPILERAAQLSPERMLKLIEIEQYEAKVTIARSGQLPQLGGSFNYGTTESAVSGSNTRESSGSGFFYNASANQALFHWGALKNSTEIARLQLLIARKDTARVTRDLLAIVRKTYLALVVQKAELQAMRRALKLIDGEIETLTIRNSQGLIPPAQLEGERLRRREEQLKADRVEAKFAADRRSLTRIAALAQPLTEDDIADGLPNPAYSEAMVAGMTATVLRDNAKNSFEYEIYDIRVREAKLKEKVEATRL
ncbi:MAG TPA: TolC family protein, partial [Opitutaceae bacterium]